MLTAVMERLKWPPFVLWGTSQKSDRPISFETFVQKIHHLDLEPKILETMRQQIAQAVAPEQVKGLRLTALGLASQELRLRFADAIEKKYAITFGSNTREVITRGCSLEFVYKRTALFCKTKGWY